MAEREIRADFDRETIVVYQAYSCAIADPALIAQRFVAPFSFQRMTWIKPSFLWMMHRSNWGQKSGQERTLAIRINRTDWEQALSLAVLTSFETSLFGSHNEWQKKIDESPVRVQWDPERSLRDARLPYYSIQIGLSRHIIREYAEQWITSIDDYTPRVRKMYQLLQEGHIDQAKRQLPPERVYPLSADLARSLWMEV
jgi:hypothetical protein